jgi:NAD(P)-dependent dehydrogenase (short-subunit alcohol dehydrogenase family)
MSWLEGRCAVVTGASRGIGRATAIALARAGARVVLAARSSHALDRAAAEAGGTSVPCDVADPVAVDRLFDAAGDVSVLVCAAGVLRKAPFADLTDDDWRTSLDVNLTGTFLCCRRAFRTMRDADGGRIVTISSLSGIYATEKFPGLAAYTVSKHGVVGLTESIAAEGREHGISAICISPGAVDTQMLREAAPQLTPGLAPEDVARFIVALLDDAIAPASGANIPLFSNL